MLGQSRSPSGMTPIAYLESSGTQLIDTLVIGGTDAEYEVEFAILSGNETYNHFFGSTNQGQCAPKVYNEKYNNQKRFVVEWFTPTRKYYTSSNAEYVIGRKYNMSYKSGSFYVNGTAKATVGTYGFGDNTFCLFGYNLEPELKAYMRLYSCKVWLDGVLVRNMTPVRIGSVGYMYDSVNGVLYGNSGTGDFILGPDLSSESEVLYIESSGTQLIDTLVTGGTNAEYEVEFAIVSGNVNYTHFFGSVRNEQAAPKVLRWTSDSEVHAQWYTSSQQEIVLNSIALDTRYNMSYKGGVFYLDNTSKGNVGTYGFGSDSFCLFGYHAESNLKASMRLYSCKIWMDGLLVRDMVPYRVGDTGYMYDRIGQTLYANTGSGDFALGPDVSDATYYHVCDGTAATVLDTGIYPVSKDYPYGFTIDTVFDNSVDTSTDQYRSIIVFEHWDSPYAGLKFRREQNSLDAVDFAFGSSGNHVRIQGDLVQQRNHAIFEYDRVDGLVNLNLNGTTTSGYFRCVNVPRPMTLGGERDSNNGAVTNTYSNCAAVAFRSFSFTPKDSTSHPYTRYTDENNVIHIENVLTQGTQATALDTGICLFDGSYPNGFELEVELIVLDTTNNVQNTFLSCKAEGMSGYPGFSLRHLKNTTTNLEVSFKPNFGSNPGPKAAAGMNTLKITYTGSSATLVFDGQTYTGSGTVATHSCPLVIGGTQSTPGQWVSDRFGSCLVRSLTIKKL